MDKCREGFADLILIKQISKTDWDNIDGFSIGCKIIVCDWPKYHPNALIFRRYTYCMFL